MWLKSKNIPLETKIIPVNRRQRAVFLYFELTCSQQMCLVVTSFKQAKPCLEILEVAGPSFGGSQIPVWPMEKPCSKGRSELAGAVWWWCWVSWDAIHLCSIICVLTPVWHGAGGSRLVAGCGVHGGWGGGTPAGQVNSAGSAGKAKLSRSPELVLREGEQVELACALSTSTAFL